MSIYGKTLNQNPFSFYDIVGYLFSGMLFIALLLAIDHCIAEGKLLQPLFKDFIYCGGCGICTDLRASREWLETGILAGLFLVISYVIGQFLGILSAFWIEKRYYVQKFGYPGNVFEPENKNNPHIDQPITPFTGCLFCKVHLCCLFNCIRHMLCTLLLFPLSLLDCIFRGVCIGVKNNEYFTEMFSRNERDLIKNTEIKICKRKGLVEKDDLSGYSFLITYHYVVEVECPHLVKIFNYIALYGFFRNICLAFLISFWIGLIFFFCSKPHIIPRSSDEFLTIIYLGLICLFAYISFLGFNKFFIRFAKEVLYAALVNKDN